MTPLHLLSAAEKPSQASPVNHEGARLAGNSEVQQLIRSAQQSLASKDLKSANKALRKAASLQPWRKEPLLLLASVEALEGRHQESIELLGAAALLAPTDPEVFGQLGAALVKSNRFAEAAGVFLQQHQLAPDQPGPLHNAGVCLQRAQKSAQAEEALTQVVQCFPTWAEGHRTLSTFLREQNRFTEALRYLLRAVEIQPGQSRDLLDLGAIYARTGQLPLAVDCFKKGYLLDPQSRGAFDNLLSSALCDSRLKRHEIESLFRRANTIYPTPKTPLPTQAVADAEPTKIRIGFVSPDLYRHAVTSFLLPLIQRLSRDQFEVVIFSNSRTADAITVRIRNSVQHWEDITTLSDAAACERIRELAIDALVDLTGHFQSNRLGIFALRAAPVQITMIGCMSTTGLAEMDYRITDAGLDPVGAEAWGSEKLVRLECGAVCLEEPDVAPEVGPLPATRNEHITFGSFNNLAKVGPDVLKVWADTLRAIPNSRLHIVAEQGSQIIERLGTLGVTSSRITVLNRVPEREYLEAHQQVDILLDTFPYNGFTITLLGAFMGVPCLTCRGEIPSARTAATVMSRLGLESFVASNQSDIPRLAASLCSDLPTLATVRASLRSAMRTSWMDGPRYAERFSEWLTDAVKIIAAPKGGRPPLKPPGSHALRADSRRESLSANLQELLKTPTLPPQALEEILLIAEKSGLEDISQAVAKRLKPTGASKPEAVLRLLEMSTPSDKATAIRECVQSGWHLRNPKVAGWLCSQLADIPAYQPALQELAARWAGRSDAPPSLLLEQAKALAQTSLPWPEVANAFEKTIESGASPYSAWMAASSAAASRKLIPVALDAVRNALFDRPGEPEAIAWMGGLLNEAGDHKTALHCTEIGFRIFPNHGAYFLSHALALEKLCRLDEAVQFAARAVELSPENPEVHKHLAYCEIRVSRADRAVSHLRRAAHRFPENQIIASNLLYCENYIEQPDLELFNKHVCYQRSLEQQGIKPVQIKSRNAGRIRIALLSGDFRKHSVSYFVKPWVENIDRSQFEVVMVSTSREEDNVTEQLRVHADDWVDASSLFDGDLTDVLRSREIDVLCDLSGHTGGNRMSAIARRCAPVQLTLIGAMQTSGLREMDYRITDRWMDPEGTTERLHTESLIRLQAGGWVFSPPSNMPDIEPLPALKNGYITFGSFNNTAKITPSVLDTWSKILSSIPDSRLLLNGFHFPTIRDGLTQRGIEASRIEFIGRPTGLEYYAQHHRVDVALDTFPFNGLTVSCFAAWMGVPTLSHPEVRSAARVGYAIASRLRIANETVAPNRESLPIKARELTRDVSSLASLRLSLRDRMREHVTKPGEWVTELSNHLVRMVKKT
jgi:predicted O-linked N-acetylglucosamine transferase (SPINDLY family)